MHFFLLQAMSSDDDASHGQESLLKPHGPEAEKKKRTWTRGSQMTPAKRAKQFQDLGSPYGVQGNSLWCMACSCAIGFKEKSTAKKQVCLCSSILFPVDFFCLGIIDTKNRQKMSSTLRQAAVCLF